MNKEPNETTEQALAAAHERLSKVQEMLDTALQARNDARAASVAKDRELDSLIAEMSAVRNYKDEWKTRAEKAERERDDANRALADEIRRTNEARLSAEKSKQKLDQATRDFALLVNTFRTERDAATEKSESVLKSTQEVCDQIADTYRKLIARAETAERERDEARNWHSITEGDRIAAVEHFARVKETWDACSINHGPTCNTRMNIKRPCDCGLDALGEAIEPTVPTLDGCQRVSAAPALTPEDWRDIANGREDEARVAAAASPVLHDTKPVSAPEEAISMPLRVIDSPQWDVAREAVNRALPGDLYDWVWVAEHECAVLMVKTRERSKRQPEAGTITFKTTLKDTIEGVAAMMHEEAVKAMGAEAKSIAKSINHCIADIHDWIFDKSASSDIDDWDCAPRIRALVARERVNRGKKP